MRLLELGLVIIPLLASTADALEIVLNNGLAPPNSENVIDGTDDLSGDSIIVRNVGCGLVQPGDLCGSPGAPTEVAVLDGASLVTVAAFDSSSVEMSGGTLSGGLLALGPAPDNVASITLSGGIVNTISAHGASTTYLSGGTVRVVVNAHGEAAIRITGGLIPGAGTGSPTDGSIAAAGSSTVNIVGTNFAVDGTAVPFGLISAQTGVVSGVLLSGEPINNTFFHNGFSFMDAGISTSLPATGHIFLELPEPSTALLLACGIAGIAATRRLRA